MLDKKLGHQVKFQKNLLYALEAIFSVVDSWKLVTMFTFMISQIRLEMGHVGSKTRSLGQIIKEPMLVTKGLGFEFLLFNAQVSHSRAIMALLFCLSDDFRLGQI